MSEAGRGRRVGNLSAETTSFVGRQAELAYLGGLLEKARLVTLTGIGGVGKTRLALRAADQARPAFRDGVWLAELSPLRDTALVGHAIFEVFRLADQTTRPVVEVLIQWLVDKRLLLVLDSCEHLTAACAKIVEALLAAAPGLRVLVTSRQPLHIPEERLMAVQPLPAADPQRGSGAANSDAAVLFAQRAAATAPGFVLDEGNRETVAQICWHLEGIPLAIELAAARLPELSPGQLSERLHARFELLTAQGTGGEAGLARHQMLRTTIGWSHELCAPLERLLWARLSVFAGGFDAEAAECICSGGPLSAQQLPHVLNQLVDKSIVQQEEQEDLGFGPVRYRILDTVREYGGQWLCELGEQEQTQRRHRDFYLHLARRGDAEWMGPKQVAWYERTVAEHANLRAALDFSLADPEGHTALEMAGNLWFFWLACGFMREGRYQLERALALDPAPSPARTRALWACGMAAAGQGDTVAAENLSAECTAAAEEQSDTESALAAYQLLGSTMSARGEQAGAAKALDKAAELYRSVDEPGPAGFVTLIARPYLCVMQGDFTRALSLIEELRAECDKRDEKWLRSFGDYQHGIVDLAHGEIHSAVVHGRAALEVKASLHDRLGTVLATDLLAAAAAAAGDGKRTARLLGFGQQLWQTFSLPQMGSPELAAMREACERQARETIGDAAYERAFVTGLRLSQEQSIRYALDEIGEQDIM